MQGRTVGGYWSVAIRARKLDPASDSGGIQDFTSPPFIEAANTPILHEAYDQLAGDRRWIAPKALGTFPIRFPSPESPGDDGWHVDMSFGFDNPDFMQWRVM
jgi:hypothetical protein